MIPVSPHDPPAVLLHVLYTCVRGGYRTKLGWWREHKCVHYQEHCRAWWVDLWVKVFAQPVPIQVLYIYVWYPWNADHKKPKLRLLRKEWFPLPNGSYHLQAAFFIDNHVGHWITRPQAPVNTVSARKCWLVVSASILYSYCFIGRFIFFSVLRTTLTFSKYVLSMRCHIHDVAAALLLSFISITLPATPSLYSWDGTVVQSLRSQWPRKPWRALRNVTVST